MFYFGADYYPEHWPEERWPEDARLMAEAGFNVVRLAEFAWSKMEPEEGRYDFGWLDRAIDVLSDHGIRVVLGTPTASPPPWLMTRSEGLFIVRQDGRRATYGNRREYCPNNPLYHGDSRHIVTEMASRYGDHPAVIAWQIDNEFGASCYCSICRASFQNWLRERYGTLDVLNAAWGTAFWSHVCTHWSQIPVPVITGRTPNPGLDLDYRRFMSDTYVRYQQQQLDILRALCPDQPITHNLMGFRYDGLNYFDLARPLDFVVWDNYPVLWFDAEADPAAVALGHDAMRGLKQQNFWVMEQQSGAGGWEAMGPMPCPGQLRLWTYQAIAHGADAIVYFRWRTARYGTEQYWHGILDHHGQPGRRYEEVKAVGAELARIGDEVLAAQSHSQVAMVLSYDSRFSLQGQPGHSDFSYPALFGSYYEALHRRNISVDIVPPSADLGAYRLVLAPALHVVGQAEADNLRTYVAGGGTLLLTARSGVKDEANAIVNMRLPGLLADICGVEVADYALLPGDTAVPLRIELPGTAESEQGGEAQLWSDVLAPTTAQTVGRYAGETYAGEPAITLNTANGGRTLYVGTIGDSALHDTVVGWLVDAADVRASAPTPAGVEATERWKDDRRLLFLMNHTAEAQTVKVPRPATELITGEQVGGELTLAPYGVAVVRGA